MSGIPVSDVDYLEEDSPIRGQNYVCLSFISPENILKNKEVFYIERFLSKLSTELKELFAGLETKYPDDVSMIKSIAENHSQFLNGNELQEYYKYFKNANQLDMEREFHEQQNFQTSVRGIKIRGVYDTEREAKVRADLLKRQGDKFNIYIAQVGCWCPWDPSPDAITDQEYSVTQLNTLMKEYNENQEKRDIFFEERKKEKIAGARSKVTDLDKDKDAWLERKMDQISIAPAAAAPAAPAAPASGAEAEAEAEAKPEINNA